MPKRKNAKGSKHFYHFPNSSLKSLLWLLGILLGLLLLSKFLSLALAMNQPLGLQPVSRPFRWDGKSSVNLLLVSWQSDSETKQSVINFNPRDEKITILDLSPQTYLELPKGFGSWKIGSVYKLGQEENKFLGSQLLTQSVSKLIALPIDGVVALKQPQVLPTEQLITNWRKNRLTFISLFNQVSSDLTPPQLARLLWRLSAVRSDKVVTLDFLQSNVTESKLLPDSTRVLGVNTVKLDLFVRKNLADSNFVEEGKSIAIFNATAHPGLTAQVARTITNLGGNVISTSNATSTLSTSQVVFSQSSLTAQRITQIYAPRCLPQGCQNPDSKIKESRAQINIILGEDYYQAWYQR